MQFTIEPVRKEDGKAIIDIFNHYVENSFAAYPEDPVPYEFFDFFLNMSEGYPFLVARDDEANVMGFAMLRPHSPMPVFSRTAETTCFIAPERTGKGMGKAMQERLLREAKEMGISSILAGISSLNSASLAFHKKRGFQECGRLLKIGRKWGQDFDVVWMQKMI
ncbi:MAG TPA: GNAT family N-acetyltransferase [Methanothrix sp.]|jgi:phosphinothricin acetyltransferase|nr:GNAT family N-acetyltransferase [Methanothrix sp.]